MRQQGDYNRVWIELKGLIRLCEEPGEDSGVKASLKGGITLGMLRARSIELYTHKNQKSIDIFFVVFDLFLVDLFDTLCNCGPNGLRSFRDVWSIGYGCRMELGRLLGQFGRLVLRRRLVISSGAGALLFLNLLLTE